MLSCSIDGCRCFEVSCRHRRLMASTLQPHVSTLRASIDHDERRVGHVFAGIITLGCVAILIAAAITVATEARDDIRATRRAVERCR